MLTWLVRTKIVMQHKNVIVLNCHVTLCASDLFRKRLQATWRGLQAKRLYRQHKAAILVQRCFRGFVVRLAVSMQHAAAVCIQKTWRRHTVQTQYSHTLQAVVSIQVKVLLLFGRGTTASLLNIRSYT